VPAARAEETIVPTDPTPVVVAQDHQDLRRVVPHERVALNALDEHSPLGVAGYVERRRERRDRATYWFTAAPSGGTPRGRGLLVAELLDRLHAGRRWTDEAELAVVVNQNAGTSDALIGPSGLPFAKTCRRRWKSSPVSGSTRNVANTGPIADVRGDLDPVSPTRLGLRSQNRWSSASATRSEATETLLAFVERNCELGSTIYTDGLSAYKELANLGYEHDATKVSAGNDPAHVALPAVHRVASLLKRWLLGTHHGGWGAQHVEAYLDEFIFRFNRRQSNARGLLFYRLLQNAVVLKKTNGQVFVTRPKPDGTKQRGRPRTRPYSTSAATNTAAPRSSKTKPTKANSRKRTPGRA
jgi:transposase-like protein